MTNEPDFKALAIAVLSWRLRHGLSQATVAARGGPSDTTISAIEAEEWNSTRPSGTLAKIDRGLWWPEGTARKVLFEGFDPVEEVLKHESPQTPGLGNEWLHGDADLPESIEGAESLVHRLSQDVSLIEAEVYDAQAKLARARVARDRATVHLHRLQDLAQAHEGAMLDGDQVRQLGRQGRLSEPGDTSEYAIAAHEEEVSIAGEQEESDTP